MLDEVDDHAKVHQIRSKKGSSLESRKLASADSRAQISDCNHLQKTFRMIFDDFNSL